MNKVVIAILAAILVGGGLWLVLNSGGDDTQPAAQNAPEDNQQQQPAEEEPASPAEEQPESEEGESSTEVSYTDNGFEPGDITIDAGDTVTWTNAGSGQMWVASDDHPIHSDYPGFDQLGNGQTYSFTFTEPGTWGYHNHSDHTQTGTITVN